MENSYGINNIKSLSFREGVRSRISMYLGTDDNDGTYQALKEIINNATDEALAGYGNKIEIWVREKENAIRVQDYGRGVPFGIRDNGENVLVSIYTKSHTGGKFDDSSYKTAAGLNGIGGSCVCLSSLWFNVFSYRDGAVACAFFDKGIVKKYFEAESDHPNGTIIEFSPDPEVFKNGEIGYSYKKICQNIENLSYLYPQVEFIIYNEETNEVNKYHSTKGIVDYIENHLDSPLNKNIIYAEASDEKDSVQIAFQWGSKYETNVVFANGLECPEGGVPVTGARTSITRTLNSLAGSSFDGDLIRKNLFYVINCKVQNPSFANQTKSKINNASLRGLTSEAFNKGLTQLKEEYPNDFNLIIDYLNRISKAEQAAERARKQVMEAVRDVEKNQKKKVFASDKLKDAEKLGQNATLLIVEGNSAAASMAVSRDTVRYGILAIRGKLINTLSNSDDKIFANEEIKLLLSAMNIIPGHYDSAKLRYGRIAICVDSDSDGYHIGLLIMAALHYLAPQFLEEKRLCWLRSPLWIVKSKGKEYYYYDDEEYSHATVKGEITRCKGLGALSAKRAHDSMFTEEFQRLDVIEPSEESLTLLEQLMGPEVIYRKKFIFNKIDFSEVQE